MEESDDQKFKPEPISDYANQKFESAFYPGRRSEGRRTVPARRASLPEMKISEEPKNLEGQEIPEGPRPDTSTLGGQRIPEGPRPDTSTLGQPYNVKPDSEVEQTPISTPSQHNIHKKGILRSTMTRAEGDNEHSTDSNLELETEEQPGPPPEKDVWDINRVLREKIQGTLPAEIDPKLFDYDETSDEDSDQEDQRSKLAYPETYSHIKLSKESIKNRQLKELWSHQGPRRDQLHTYMNYRFRLIPNDIPWWLKIIVNFTKYWDFVIFALTAATFFILTYVSVFAFFEENLFRTVFAFDIIFLIDVSFRISLELWRYKKQVPYIILISPYDFHTWLLDALSIFPFERFAMLIYGTNSLEALNKFDVYRYNRFLRFFRVFTFLDASESERRISERLHFFIKYSLIYVMFIQFCACVFFGLIALRPIDILMRKQPENKDTWLQDFDSKKPGFGNNDYDYYVLSIYFSTSVVTTTGYGDLDANNTIEMIVSLVTMLIGAIVLRGLFSSRLTNLELKKDGARFDLFHRVDCIQEHLQELRAASLFCDKVKEYYPLLWNFRSGVQEVPFFSILPRSMQEDIKLDFSDALFHKSPLFRGLDSSFLRAVASSVEVILYNPGMVLCNAGQFGMVMYYVLQGELRTTGTRRVGINAPFNEVILRPGTLFGEMNLFFSYPHTRNIETRTCCQIVQVDKDAILEIILRFPQVLDKFRMRLQIKLKELHKYHQTVGRPPASWVYASEDLLFYRGGNKIPRNNFPVIFRRATGLNRKVYKDFIDDSKYGLIVEMPCIDNIYLRHYTVAYEHCIIPNILIDDQKWIRNWAFIMMLVSLVMSFSEPYCNAFRIEQGIFLFWCTLIWEARTSVFLFVMYCFDTFIEITHCVPCTGLYFQLIDGFRVQRKNIILWLDVIGYTISFVSNIFYPQNKLLELFGVAGIAFRIWRVNRYLTFLDNTRPKYVFYYRLIKTVLILLIGSHFLACINHGLACPAPSKRDPTTCRDLTWLNSYELNSYGFDLNVHHSNLGDNAPFLLSYFYAVATISTAGFGDFSSQEQTEMFVIIFFQLVSFYMLCFSAAILTSALSCAVRPRLLVENKLQSIKTFMKHYGIPEALRERVHEHYLLQGKLWRGVQLPPDTFHLLFDSPAYLQDDALLMEFFEHFDGVSLLAKMDSKLLVRLSKFVRRYLLPPNIVFVRKGEVRRKLYIIAKGSVGFFGDDLDAPPNLTLVASCHFGIRDLIIGEPAHFWVKTLSYAVILEIDYSELLFLMSREPQLESLLFATKVALQDHIANMATELAIHKVELKEKVPSRLAWINMPTKERDIPQLTYHDYNEVYESSRLGCVFRMYLLDKVINPNGHFAIFWTGFISIISILTIGTLLTESFMQLRTRNFRYFQYSLDIVNFIDIYFRFHWAFYTREGLLVVHPFQTALYYILEGTFVYDICFCIPFEFVLSLYGVTNFGGTSGGVHWFTKLRWVRFGQIMRIYPILQICHDIFKARSTVLESSNVDSIFQSAFATYLACPVGLFIWKEGDEDRYNFCDTDAWTAKKDMIAVQGFSNRWIVGIYYVSEVILLIGYGDMITLKEEELLLLIFMMLFGCVIIVCALADVTAAEVDLENVRLGYLENMKRMEILMERERVHPALHRSVRNCLLHTWDKTRGLQAKTLFDDLHPALRADLYETFVGLMIRRVPLFKGLNDNIMRRLAQCLQKYYFVKGERLARTENLETLMYIIVDGKVWITDHNRRWAYTLKGGESFGEVCMVYGTRRTFNAFAGSSVEAFALTREDYINVLLRYPTVGADLKRRLKRNKYNDMYTKIRKKVRREEYEDEEITFKTQKMNTFLRSRNVYDSTFEQPQRKSWFRRKVFDYGHDTAHLPFFYFVSPSEKFKFLIHPACPFVVGYMELVAVICCLTACLGVLEASFGNIRSVSLVRLPVVRYSKYVFEGLMYIRILLGFVIPFEKVDESFCKEHKLIALRYVTNILGFPLDLLGSLPVYLYTDYESWTRWLPLIRVIRLIPFYRFQFHKEEDIRRSTLRQKVTISVVSFLLVAHFLACIFYAISPCTCPLELGVPLEQCSNVEQMCPAGTWTQAYVLDRGLTDSSGDRAQVTEIWRWYLRSLYWVVTTISTTGFGTIVPHSIPEIVLGIICIYCGSFLLSIILSHFTSGISSITQSYREYFFQVNILNSYYKTIGISKDKERRVNTYFVYYWEKMRGVPYHTTTSNLPITLKIDLCYALYGSVLEDCRLFEACTNDVSFMRQLCSVVQHGYYCPGTNICTIGDAAVYLYIVYRGNVLSWEIEDERIKICGAFNVSEAFGKHGVLIYESYFNKNYRAETHVEVLTVPQLDLLKLCEDFPIFGAWLENYTVNTIDVKDHQDTIFDYQRSVAFANRRNKFSQQYIEAEQDTDGTEINQEDDLRKASNLRWKLRGVKKRK